MPGPTTPNPQTNFPTIAETIARYAVNLKYEDIPPEVLLTAKRIIIDTIGAFIDEMCAVPNGVYRDQADATGGAYNKLAGKRKAGMA